MELTNSERHLIELLRRDERLMLMIHRSGDCWHIRIEDPDTGVVGTGTGSDFSHAWDRLDEQGMVAPKLRVVRTRRK
jgi:hypothetical protein